MIYLDASAIFKLVREERETRGLQAWFGQRSEEPAATSELGRVEVLRAARRVGPAAVEEARALVDGLDLVPLSRDVQDLASELGEPALRTLDALHLASAMLLGEALTVLVTYDARLAGAARSSGLTVSAPGGMHA